MAKWHVAPLRFAPAFRALGVCEHISLRYKNFDPSCFDPIQKIWYDDLRTNSDFPSLSFDLFLPTRIRMAVGDDKISHFTVDNYVALKLKYPRGKLALFRTHRYRPSQILISTSEFFVLKVLVFLPNGSSARLDCISPQILIDLTAKSNGQTGLNILRVLKSLVYVILDGKVTLELRPYFFGAKLNALKKLD